MNSVKTRELELDEIAQAAGDDWAVESLNEEERAIYDRYMKTARAFCNSEIRMTDEELIEFVTGMYAFLFGLNEKYGSVPQI